MTAAPEVRAGGAPEPAPAEETARHADPSAAGGGGWRALLLQPALVVLGVAAFLVWRLTADLSDTEARQLGWGVLGDSIREHLALTVVAAVIVLLIAVPLGIALTRRPLRRLSPLVVGIANTGQAAPAIGLFVLLATWLGFGFGTTVVALVVYAALPVLRNTMVGIQGVDERLVEAGRGMGMSALAVLLRVELPLAVPVLLAGVRTALVLLVGTATLATFIDGGGLGVLINTGITLSLDSLLISGAVLVALLALAVDWLGRVVEHVARPKGL
ncbi:ABC transporter permease [Blastococcus sp. MG754426]|uniref:ABC transporter permease n=1 Tax=unclassified Blastococcus TaxID=2619396 RepID=UPI001EEF90A2|nr:MULTISPECIES: ABC transporter permease [unclassified Blastococcus]MCF6507686.1 ABC transporter permease [Blastococcus sp. MG754426]MCF6511175.1 ABC transporter permease [Blastococcus sp. MG754427]MCF6735366.1 ABC transporter permease [Blastococcus sp. KM273129]